MNNREQEINRIKSLFTEERLYGNLIKEVTLDQLGAMDLMAIAENPAFGYAYQMIFSEKTRNTGIYNYPWLEANLNLKEPRINNGIIYPKKTGNEKWDNGKKITVDMIFGFSENYTGIESGFKDADRIGYTKEGLYTENVEKFNSLLDFSKFITEISYELEVEIFDEMNEAEIEEYFVKPAYNLNVAKINTDFLTLLKNREGELPEWVTNIPEDGIITPSKGAEGDSYYKIYKPFVDNIIYSQELKGMEPEEKHKTHFEKEWSD